MATAIHLKQSTLDALDAFVATRGFSSHDEAIRSALQIVGTDDTPLTEAQTAALRRSIAQADAGMLIPIEEVRSEMERRFAS